MSMKKYLPSGTQTVQVFLIVAGLTALGVIAKGTSFFQKLLGRV